MRVSSANSALTASTVGCDRPGLVVYGEVAELEVGPDRLYAADFKAGYRRKDGKEQEGEGVPAQDAERERR
jgi:hypothetical protein